MKNIKKFIRRTIKNYMLNSEDYVPIYVDTKLSSFVYRKVGE